MEYAFMILLGAETLLLIVFVYLLIHRSQQLTLLFKEFALLRKQDRDLQKSQKIQEDYVPMLVHELRSPLSVIKGSADLIIKEAQNLSQEDIVKFLSQIRTSSDGLLRIVNDILDISKMDSGALEVRKEKANLNKLLEDEKSYYDAKAHEKNIRFSLDLDPNLMVFKFDPSRLRQVLNNLVSNALKFTPSGGTVSIKSEKVGDVARISVLDTGPGIPENMRPKLFHKFVQLHNNNSHEKGTGLGLVIAKGLVEAHGGKIWIEDNKPKGAKFIFTVPLEV